MKKKMQSSASICVLVCSINTDKDTLSLKQGHSYRAIEQ